MTGSASFFKYSYSRVEMRGRVTSINAPMVSKKNGKKNIVFYLSWEHTNDQEAWNVMRCFYQGDKRASMFESMVKPGDWLYLWGRIDRNEKNRYDLSVWTWAYDMMMDKRFHEYEKQKEFMPKRTFSRRDNPEG